MCREEKKKKMEKKEAFNLKMYGWLRHLGSFSGLFSLLLTLLPNAFLQWDFSKQIYSNRETHNKISDTVNTIQGWSKELMQNEHTLQNM